MPYFGFLTPSSKRTLTSLSLTSQPMAAKTGAVAGLKPEIGNDSEVNEWSELLTNEQAKKLFRLLTQVFQEYIEIPSTQSSTVCFWVLGDGGKS